MPKHRQPIHPHGTYFLHGDGRPRQVRILDIGIGPRAGKIHVHDGRTRFWIEARHLHRSPRTPRADGTGRHKTRRPRNPLGL